MPLERNLKSCICLPHTLPQLSHEMSLVNLFWQNLQVSFLLMRACFVFVTSLTIFYENKSYVFIGCRSARETTPCSLIRDSETIVSLGSTTWPTKSTASIKMQASVASCIPTAFELEELFSGPEQLQQRSFMEK